jgi:signal transduction histidine kinase
MASELDRLRVLLIEDNLADARLTRELLNEANPGGFDLVHAATLQHGIDALATAEFGIVLLDLSLIDAQGLDTVRRLRQQHPRVPIIVVSGLDDEEVALEALHNGAQDYLVKGQGDGHLIARAMRYAIERKRTELQLIEARDLAEAASQAKSAFLANMSHELRTPLNAIIGLTELLCDNAARFGTEKALEPLRRVLRAGRHLLSLINDILDLSKIEAGKMDLTLESVAIRPVVDEMLGTARPLAEQNKNALELDCPDEIGSVHADNMRLRQILLNLLSNACKFTKAGTLRLRVARTTEAGQGWVDFAVSDSGIGMTEEQLGVPGILAGGRVDHAAIRRHRARACDQPQALPADGRRHNRDERAGRGVDLHRPPAGRSRDGSRRRSEHARCRRHGTGQRPRQRFGDRR